MISWKLYRVNLLCFDTEHKALPPAKSKLIVYCLHGRRSTKKMTKVEDVSINRATLLFINKIKYIF